MKSKLYCDCCGKELTMFDFKVSYGIVKIKTCSSCANHYIDVVKTKYRVETYKGNDIYKKDGKYFPYWDCPYCFDTLQECKDRIDSKVGIYLFQ